MYMGYFCMKLENTNNPFIPVINLNIGICVTCVRQLCKTEDLELLI